MTHREMERREKVEEARRETERILAAQEAEVAARKVRLARRPAAVDSRISIGCLRLCAAASPMHLAPAAPHPAAHPAASTT
jgi:hypothetical protein